jgi:Fe-S-cluster containining protein
MPDYKFSGPMECRPGCAACCIAPSISSPIPGMPDGKAAGEPCVQLDGAGLCQLFGTPQRPKVCLRFSAGEELCGNSTTEAMQRIATLERLTR